MNLISCRENFVAPIDFGPHICRRPDETQYSYSSAEQTTILIHGYHSSEKSAQESYQTIAESMAGLKFTGYLWPGGALRLSFPFAVERARQAGWRLRDVLNGCVTARFIDIQTHSLGARVALEALKYGANVGCRHLILTAPAVDDDCLERKGEFGGALDNVVSVNVFYSRRDEVLRGAFPVGTLFREQALGLNGPKNILPRVRAFDCSRVVDSHGGYRFAPEFFAAWRAILDGSAAPGLTVL